MRSLKVSGIIHLFAVLHAVVALSCHLAGINDELVLTLLTIVLIVLICLKRGLNVEFTAASVIVVNVIGYLLGTGGAQLIELLLHAPPVVHAVSTFITTEILGWSIVWFTKLFRRGDDTASRSSAWTPRIGLLLLAVGVIFVLRLAYVELFTSPSFSTDRLYHMADLLVSNSAALIILLCVNIIYVRHTRRRETRHGPIAEIAAFLLFVLLTSACVALITGLHLPFAFDRSFTAREFLQLWIITLLVEVILYSVVFMVDYALVARAVLRAERGKAHQAQFRYMKLKQQVNPHFLFNSLNSLYALDTLQKPQSIVKAAFELKLLALSGYEPLLDGCAVCGTHNPKEPVFDAQQGVLLCKECADHGGSGLLPLDAGSFAAMRHVLFSEPKRMLSFSLSGETEKRFAAACEVFAQVQLDRRFKTLDFYKSMKIDN